MTSSLVDRASAFARKRERRRTDEKLFAARVKPNKLGANRNDDPDRLLWREPPATGPTSFKLSTERALDDGRANRKGGKHRLRHWSDDTKRGAGVRAHPHLPENEESLTEIRRRVAAGRLPRSALILEPGRSVALGLPILL